MPGYVKPDRPATEGHHGPMYVGDLYEILKRNSDLPVHFTSTRWGSRNGAPTDTCTLTTGPTKWDIRQNVSAPWVPEFNIAQDPMNPASEYVARGWRSLMSAWIRKGYMRPSSEVQSYLGRAWIEAEPLLCPSKTPAWAR